MLSQGMEKKEIIKVLDNLDKFIVKREPIQYLRIDSEFVWYTRNRDFDTAICPKILAYNLVVIYNHFHDRSLRRIMHIIQAV